MRDDKDELRAALIGALVGMARAADPGGLDGDALRIAVGGLAASHLEADVPAEALQAWIDRAHGAKYALSPDCRDCPHPCPRTADFDLRELDLIGDGEVRALRLELLLELQRLAQGVAGRPRCEADGAALAGLFADGLMDFAHAFQSGRLRATLARVRAEIGRIA